MHVSGTFVGGRVPDQEKSLQIGGFCDEVAGATGLRLALGAYDPAPLMTNADDMLDLAASRASQLAAPGLSPRPRRKVAVLACMDTRIDLFPMLGLERGDAHIIRNAGGLVTDDALRSLSASQRLLGTEEIVVVMHEGCGLQGASEDEYAQALSRRRGPPRLAPRRVRRHRGDPRPQPRPPALGPGAPVPRPHPRLHLRPGDRDAARGRNRLVRVPGYCCFT